MPTPPNPRLNQSHPDLAAALKKIAEEAMTLQARVADLEKKTGVLEQDGKFWHWTLVIAAWMKDKAFSLVPMAGLLLALLAFPDKPESRVRHRIFRALWWVCLAVVLFGAPYLMWFDDPIVEYPDQPFQVLTPSVRAGTSVVFIVTRILRTDRQFDLVLTEEAAQLEDAREDRPAR